MTFNINFVNNTYIIGSNVTYSDGLDELKSYKGSSLIIPATDTSGNPIKQIGFRAFFDYQNLKFIHIEPSIEVFGPHSFQNCINLISINIPFTTKYLLNNVFDDCLSLKHITFDFPSSVVFLGYGLFNTCHSLKNIVLPPSIKIISTLAFSDMTSINIYSYINEMSEACDTDVFAATNSTTIYVPLNGPKEFCGVKTKVSSAMKYFHIFTCVQRYQILNLINIFILSI